MASSIRWWQKVVFYQIYPRSFADGNNDGIGDFAGIISKLDLLQELGIGGIWLSPHYPSPFVDCGYDISDYCAVDPAYGTMADFKQLLSEAHARGIRVVLDLVLNHTSDHHPWFMESRSSLDNPKRDWYIWRKGKGNQPPTNWFSTFGGSAWQLDELTGEYYYHFFFKEQPDLNWNNPAVKATMFNAARFWMDMGVDGFRLDAIGTIFEDECYLDQPVNTTLDQLYYRQRKAKTAEDQTELEVDFQQVFQYQHDQPGVHELMQELRSVVNEYSDRVLIGETDEIAFYGEKNDELHLNFNFPLMRTRRITPQHVLSNQHQRLSNLPEGAWPCNTLGNHDSARMFNQFGDGQNDDAIARVNMLMLLTLKGTPFLYNGEEIGMTDTRIDSLDRFVDPLGKLYYRMEKEVMGSPEEVSVRVGAEHSRDKCRTPFQWSAEPNAGFCPAGVIPWLPVNENYVDGVNFAAEYAAPDSFWWFMQHLIHLRNSTPALNCGDYFPLKTDDPEILVYQRTCGDQVCLVAMNMSGKTQNVEIMGEVNERSSIWLATDPAKVHIIDGMLTLEAWSGAILG